MIEPCDRWHATTPEIQVVNYGLALARTIARGASLDEIGAAIKRLRHAADRLDKSRGKGRRRRKGG